MYQTGFLLLFTKKTSPRCALKKDQVRSRYVLSSSEEDQSVTRHRSSKPSETQPSGPLSDQDQPQHDPDPPYYREVATTSGVNNSSQTVPQLCVPQHLNLHAWCVGVDSSKNKASLWRWQRELLPLRGHQQGPSTSQSGPYLRNGADKIRWISPLHL